MFLNRRTMTFTGNSWDSLQRLHELLQKTDTVRLGSGGGTRSGCTGRHKPRAESFTSYVESRAY